jgi:hypothetical protein
LIRHLPRPDYLSHPRMAREAQNVTDATRIEAVERFAPAFQKAWRDWITLGQPDFSARIPEPGDAALAAVQRDGVAVVKVDPGLKAQILQAVGGELARIQARVAALEGKPRFSDMNTELTRAAWPEVYALMDEAFARLQVLEIGSAYAGRPLRVKRLYAQINTAEETALRYGPIDDQGLPARKSDYWHIDSDIFPSFKALFYLNEVGPHQGPFRYVPGSHRNLDSFETVTRKVNDGLKLSAAQFLSLPDPLRLHALFGPYMTGDEPEARALLEQEMVCIGDGDLILFDNNGVHRGGFVREGSRQLMQILFEPAPGANEH